MNRNIKAALARTAYSPVGYHVMQWLRIPQLYADYIIWSSKRRELSIAKREFSKGTAKGSYNDFKCALDKHWVSYNEYAYQYEFYNKTEEEREEFVSRSKMGYFYRRYTPGNVKAIFRNKHRFLTLFSKYIHREWIYAPNASYEEFSQLVSNFDCIIKPCDGALGRGVFKVYKNGDHTDDRKLYESCVKDRMLVEQCIESCEELNAFHPQSLNTIRVVTVANKQKAEVFGSFLRMGVGNSVVDNAHAGGVFAQINIKDGMIESDGIDTNGNRYVCHPDSCIKLKGFVIPNWEKVVNTCCEAAKLCDNTIMGWDVAINNQMEIDFVETSFGPDFDVMQSPLQVGVKKRIFAKIKEYSGIEMK